jgi:hypothetical protein
LHFFISVIHHCFGIAMITSRRDFLAANPGIECMIAPFYFRIFTHHKSPKFRASLCPKHRSRSYPLQVSFPPLAVAKRTNVIGPTLWWTGSALAYHRAMSQRGLRLARSKVPPVRDSGRYPFGRCPTTRHADLEAGVGAEMPVVPDAAVFTGSRYDRADRNSRDCAVSVGSPGR